MHECETSWWEQLSHILINTVIKCFPGEEEKMSKLKLIRASWLFISDPPSPWRAHSANLLCSNACGVIKSDLPPRFCWEPLIPNFPLPVHAGTFPPLIQVPPPRRAMPRHASPRHATPQPSLPLDVRPHRMNSAAPSGGRCVGSLVETSPTESSALL